MKRKEFDSDFLSNKLPNILPHNAAPLPSFSEVEKYIFPNGYFPPPQRAKPKLSPLTLPPGFPIEVFKNIIIIPDNAEDNTNQTRKKEKKKNTPAPLLNPALEPEPNKSVFFPKSSPKKALRLEYDSGTKEKMVTYFFN